MDVKVKPRFAPGWMIHEVFRDDDIDAWNVCSWKVARVKIVIDWHPYSDDDTVQNVEYYSEGDFSYPVLENLDNLFPTSLGAANEAKRRNQEERKSLEPAEPIIYVVDKRKKKKK